MRHKAISSLRASATIMVLRTPLAPALGAGAVPLRQRAVLLEHEEAPGELDHRAAHTRAASRARA